MRLVWSSQYNIHCVVAEPGDTATAVIDRCREPEISAFLTDDGVEFCVQLRDEIGPALWTEQALHRSLPLAM